MKKRLFFTRSPLKALPDFMVRRIAVLLIFASLGLSACKKGSLARLTNSTPNPTATPTPAPTAVATPFPTPKKPLVDQNAEVIVFGYHRFVNKVRRPDTEITPAAFEEQMKELKDKQIPVIGMQDFLAWRRGEKNIPPHCAIITIDDGYKSGYEVAWPILKKYGYPVTMFIYTEGIKPGKYSGGESMSWEQLAEMRDAGVDIQSHTVTHQDLRKPPYDRFAKKRLSKDDYEPWLENEVAGSKQTIEQKLGVKVNCFAVPYGYYNDHVKEVAIKAGYDAMFTVYGQKLTYGSPMDSLGRYMIEANKPKVFADAINFGGETAGGSVPVAEVSAVTLGVVPADGETVKSAAPMIKANLAGFGAVDQGSVQMRISGLGLVNANYDPKTQNISYQVPQKIKDKTCTVIIEAKSGDKKVSTHWSFNIEEAVTAPVPSPVASPAKP
jgi:peptidoglycan/xylan/chitin deacetylase (PgdA/CDA1 family)